MKNEPLQPGEPFKPLIDSENILALEKTRLNRVEIMKGKLSDRQYKKTVARIRWLHKRLNKMKYNQLLVKRESIHKQYTALATAIRNKESSDIATFKTLGIAGRKLNEQISALKPLHDEWLLLNGKLKTHQSVLEWEKKEAHDYLEFRKEAHNWEELILSVFRQSARLHHRWEDKHGKWRVDIPKINHIFVTADKIMYQVETAKQTLIQRWLGLWTNSLPYNVDISDLVSDETLENLSTICNRVVTIERSKRGTNLFYVISRLDSPDNIPSNVLYAKLAPYYPIKEHHKTPWCGGMTADRKVEWFNFEETPHWLIAGSTKSGKSNHINQMIATLVTMNTPDELRLVLIDNKGGVEFTHWKELNHLLMPMVKRPEGVIDALNYIRDIMDVRLNAFETAKAKNLMSYNDKVLEKLPRIVVFIDELATLLDLGQLTKDIHTQLRVISSQGRAVGIHLVLCTQHPSIDVIPNTIKTNMTRVSGRMPSIAASMVVLDSISAAELPNIPGRLIFSLGRYEITAQSPFISDEEVAHAVYVSQQYAPSQSDSIMAIPEPTLVKTKFTANDAIAVALSRLDGQLSANKMISMVSGISHFELRRVIDTITNKEYVVHNEIKYRIKRVGKAYYLKTMETAMESENDDKMSSA